jgi:hypothetical protein
VRVGDRGDTVKTARFAIGAVAAMILLCATNAHAASREETAAKGAMTRARAEHARRHFGRAYQILSQAEKACEPDRCAPETLAILLRDMGTMRVLNGEEDKARNDFAAALAFDASIALDPAYATDDVRALFASVKSPSAIEQPSGDFDHTPAAAQRTGVPLPVYVEYHGTAHPAQVVVRYEENGKYRRLALERVGSGWGNVIPCGAVKLGTLHYYFQGLDSEGLPILDGGDKRHPYSVPIKDVIDGPLPHLPDHRAPTMCGEGMISEETTETTTQPNAPAASTRGSFARIWIGVSGSIDFTVVPSGKDICARDASGNSVDPNWACTSETSSSAGLDFPRDQTENGTLVTGESGKVASGLETANVRVKATFDWALTPNFLVGAAFGFVANAYGGTTSPKLAPIHIEARGTWVFGDAPLAHAGFAPYIQLAAGVAEYDATLTVTVSQNNVAGQQPVQAWHVGGPGFVALEGGVRYAFSPRAAFLLGARATAAFGINFFPAFGPDAALQFGF